MRISDVFRIHIPMEEQVTDISKVLQNMAKEMRLMRETINQQYVEITKLLQKSEMRKDIVIELSYRGFSRASDYS